MTHFTLLKTSGTARRGVLNTAHGAVQTPAFCPVGTAATVKGLSPADLVGLGAEMILCNAYHLDLRPGHEAIARRGGLHRFMAWPHPILTDSGGYQVFSLKLLRKISDDGVVFQSHIDGSRRTLTPERVIEIEAALGADVIMPLDECLSYPSDLTTTAKSLVRTSAWAARAQAAHRRPDQFLYGIVQGGFYPELRRDAAARLLEMGFDGYAIGGLSVGEPASARLEMLDATVPHLPTTAPRYLMGVGAPEDLVEGVMRGIDLFDCVLPTRHARTGALFTEQGTINIRNARWAEDDRPLDPDCGCYTCQHFSRAYLRHLFMARELLALRLNTLHNLHHHLTLMQRLRDAIETDTLAAFAAAFYAKRNRPAD